MPRLLFFRDESERPLFSARLRQTRTRIGRVDDCDVVLPDDAVSRSHLLIDQLNGEFHFIDRSSNGTFLNGERKERGRLSEGDKLRIGPFTAVCELNDPANVRPTEEAQAERRDEELVSTDEGLAITEAYLTIRKGLQEGERFRLRGARVSVGGHGSKIVLKDASLVREHVKLRLLHGRAMIEPGNGAAFVNGTRVRDLFPLYPNEEVRVGNTEFVVHWDERLDTPSGERFGEMVGETAAMQRVFGVLRRVAAHHAPVLLLGESGTGKELAARAVHDASPRAGRPFIAINCSAIAQNLFESELFGHEKGAFTGASDRRDGAFQRADGGTLMLDEVGELPEDSQAKLLRVLESGEVRRVGSSDVSFPDVRVIAATNRDLSTESQRGRFRRDLYFRLAVLTIKLPALRERRDDIPVIASVIARRVHPDIRIEPAAMEALKAHDWPGNARELRNVITRAYVLGGLTVTFDTLMFNSIEGVPLVPREAERRAPPIDEAERQLLSDVMERWSQNRSLAAKELGIPRSSLIYKLKRFGLA